MTAHRVEDRGEAQTEYGSEEEQEKDDFFLPCTDEHGSGPAEEMNAECHKHHDSCVSCETFHYLW